MHRLRIWGLLLLLVMPATLFAFQEEVPLPKNGAQWLRHEKHGLLAFGESPEGPSEVWLVTRKETIRRPLVLDITEISSLQQFRGEFRLPHSYSARSATDMMDLAYRCYEILIAPFRKELDQL